MKIIKTIIVPLVLAMTLLSCEDKMEKADLLSLDNNFIEAFDIYKKAAERGNVYATYRLARAYAYGLGTEIDEQRARIICHHLTEKGVVTLDEARILMLHKEPADSIDVLLIGSSATYSGYSAAYAYEKYGFTSYPYAIKGATCTLWKPALKDALRTQQPKLVVVDVFGGGYDRELIETRSSQLYNLMNAVPFSEDKIKTAREISSNLNNVSAASMVFPFIKFPTVLTEQDPDELLVNLRANRILEIAGEYGCGTLNMQKLFHEIGLKEQVDYYNHGHPNVRGQKKITDYLGRYIRDEMHVGPSSLDDSVRAEWDESIEYYKAFVSLAEELMRQKKHVTFGDTPAVVRDLKRILDGEDIEKIAEKYHSDK